MTPSDPLGRDPILRTKLHRPRVGADIFHRQRLHERLNGGLLTPLTLVAAPTGYGKSVEVSRWVDVVVTPMGGTDHNLTTQGPSR